MISTDVVLYLKPKRPARSVSNKDDVYDKSDIWFINYANDYWNCLDGSGRNITLGHNKVIFESGTKIIYK